MNNRIKELSEICILSFYDISRIYSSIINVLHKVHIYLYQEGIMKKLLSISFTLLLLLLLAACSGGTNEETKDSAESDATTSKTDQVLKIGSISYQTPFGLK